MRIKENLIHSVTIERSEFICYLMRCFSADEAKEQLQAIKKEHPDATHHCYGLVVGNTIQRSNDDGEPSGTAGMPILEALRKNNLEDVHAVVVRYFGGIKLGAGGLIRAYGKVTNEAIHNSVLTEIQPRHRYMVSFSYDYIGKMEFALKDLVEIEDKDYGELVTFTYLCQNPIDTVIQELTNGRYMPEFIETIQTEAPVN